jgi:hypothetical protein
MEHYYNLLADYSVDQSVVVIDTHTELECLRPEHKTRSESCPEDSYRCSYASALVMNSAWACIDRPQNQERPSLRRAELIDRDFDTWVYKCARHGSDRTLCLTIAQLCRRLTFQV